jgi:hypothetical protein
MNDNIVEKIHAIRGAIFEECGSDSDKLAAYYLQLQEESQKEPAPAATMSKESRPKLP